MKTILMLVVIAVIATLVYVQVIKPTSDLLKANALRIEQAIGQVK